MGQMRAHRYANLYTEALEAEITQVIKDESVCVIIPPTEWDKLIAMNPGIQLLDSMVHFKMKFGPGGEFIKPKCRIVVRGDQQESGSAGETYAACPRRSPFRLLAALAAARGLKLSSVDISGAFLEEQLREIVYVKFATKQCKEPRPTPFSASVALSMA